MIRFLKRNKRTIFHSFLIGLGCIFALELEKDYGQHAFWIVISFLVFIQFLEIYLNWRFATKVLKQIDMPRVNVYSLWGHLLNHIFIPFLLLMSFAGFIFFNQDDLARLVAIGLLTCLHLVLFINIRSYYQDEFKREKETEYIYDLIKLFIFFFSVHVVLHMSTLYGLGGWFVAFVICIFSLFLGFLLIYRRNQVTVPTIIYISVHSFIVAVVFLLLNVWGVVLIGINIITFLFFYFGISILHNKLERTLTVEIFLQYILMISMAFLLFLGIT